MENLRKWGGEGKSRLNVMGVRRGTMLDVEKFQNNYMKYRAIICSAYRVPINIEGRTHLFTTAFCSITVRCLA